MANFKAREFKQIEDTATFWKDHPDVTVKNHTPAGFMAKVGKINRIDKQIQAMDKKRMELDGVRDRLFTEAMDIKDRIRKGAVSALGPDAPELRKLGLTPRSERRRPTRKRSS